MGRGALSQGYREKGVAVIESGTLQRWKFWSLATITALLSVFPRFFHLNLPFERDEGAYAYMADVIQRGGLPYVNGFDHKPPLIYYLYNLSFNLLGHEVSSPRVLAILFVGAASFLLFVLVHRITRKLPAAIFSALVLGVASSSPAYLGLSANTELFTLPFIVGGMLLLFAETPSSAGCFVSGLVFGIGFLIKQPVAVIAGFVFAAHGIRLVGRWAALFRTVGLFSLGMSLPLGLVMLFFYLQGGFTQFWTASFSYNFGYIDQVSSSESLSLFSTAFDNIFSIDPFTWIAGVAGVLLMSRSGIRFPMIADVLMLMVGSLVATAMGKYYFPHYFVFMLPALSLTAGLGLAGILNWMPGTRSRGVILSLAFIPCLATARFIPYTDAEIFKLCYPYTTFFQSRTVGEYLRKSAPKDASVYIVGSEPELLFYSGLRSASRVFYFFPLVTPTVMTDKLRQETIAELVMHPPDFVVIVNEIHSLSLKTVAGDMFMNDLFDHFSHYRLIGIIADNTNELVTADQQKMRRIAGKGAAILLLGRPTDEDSTGVTFGKLLGRKGG